MSKKKDNEGQSSVPRRRHVRRSQRIGNCQFHKGIRTNQIKEKKGKGRKINRMMSRM